LVVVDWGLIFWKFQKGFWESRPITHRSAEAKTEESAILLLARNLLGDATG
jgi:hypothetical protein